MAVRRFFQWWGAELAGLLPRGLRNASRRRPDTLRFEMAPNEVTVSHDADGHRRELGRVPRGSASQGEDDSRLAVAALIHGLKAEATRVLVSVPRRQALVKELKLPSAAEENLAEVLSFEMERQTPFRAQDVYFNYRLVDREPATQSVSVRLGVAQRQAVDEALSLVDDWALDPARLSESEDEDGDELSLVFLPQAYRRSGETRLNAVLGGANLILIIGLCAIPLVQQELQLKSLRTEVAKARKAASAATVMQERVDDLLAENRLLAERKASVPPVVALLSDLSAMLPDATFLHRLEVKGGKVNLQGTSDSASSLIAPLEESESLKDVHFVSPVTQDAARGGERFHLSAQVAPTGGDS